MPSHVVLFGGTSNQVKSENPNEIKRILMAKETEGVGRLVEIESNQATDYIEVTPQGQKRVVSTVYKRTKDNPQAEYQGCGYTVFQVPSVGTRIDARRALALLFGIDPDS